MSNATSQHDEHEPNDTQSRESRAVNLGWGIGLLVAGVIMVAKQLGWISGTDWLLPAVVLGLATKYLYMAFSRR